MAYVCIAIIAKNKILKFLIIKNSKPGNVGDSKRKLFSEVLNEAAIDGLLRQPNQSFLEIETEVVKKYRSN